MSSGFSNGFLVLRDLLVDALVVDGVELPDPKSVDDPRYKGSFRGYFDVPPGTHTVVGRTNSGKEHAMTVVVHPGWATVKRLDLDDGWREDDAETELHYRHLAMSGSMQDAGALRPWPLPVPAADPAEGTRRVFSDADFTWLRATFDACARTPTRADSAAVQRYVDALRWHYILDSEMGAQAPYFARLGHELCEQVRSRPQLLATGAATYLDYFAVDLVDADKPETIDAGHQLAKALEHARQVAPPPSPTTSTATETARPSASSPLPMVALAVALVVGVVLLLRRSSDTPTQPPSPIPSAVAAAGEATPGAAVVDLATARKKVSLFIYEADLAKLTPLVDAAGNLESALAKDDCLAARRPFDTIKETKVDLTEHTALVLAQIRMLTTVAAYCNPWQSPDGKRW